VAEIAWTHNVLIMEKCKDSLEREFYIRMSRKFGWSKNVLAHQIENKTYEKTLLNQTNFDKALPENIKNQAKLAVKDEYTFDFLELGEEHSEKELEGAILRRLEKFLREMGGMFAFIGRQVRLDVAGEEYFLDLLLYHRSLKALVAVELKVGKFVPEHVGKMQFYLGVLDERMRLPDENPSIGIILCKTKNKTIVEFALKESRKAIGIAAYRIVTQLPSALKGKLPEPSRIAQLLNET
jgi:predicted nuclease of restriction endonuclease-like (RecB) superfamily